MSKQQILYDVSIRGTKVGTITGAQFASLRSAAYRDLRLAGAQLFALCGTAFSIASALVLGIPMVAFWGAVAIATYEPETFPMIASELQHNPAEAVRMVVLLSATVMFFLGALMGFAGFRFSFRNCYREAINRMVRRHCHTALDGEPLLMRREHCGVVPT